MNKLTINTTLVAAILLMAMAFAYFSFKQPALASAPPGLQASIATSTGLSMAAVTPMLIAATSSCSARIVSTAASAITLTFSDVQGIHPTNTIGHVQAASTTMAYDSGQYGCGAMWGYSFAAQILTVSESR